jgi:hypothetical protein
MTRCATLKPERLSNLTQGTIRYYAVPFQPETEAQAPPSLLAGRPEHYFFEHRKRNLLLRGSQPRLLAWSPASPVGKQEKPFSRGLLFGQLAHPNHACQPESGDRAKACSKTRRR